MLSVFSRIKSTIIAVVFLALLGGNVFFWQSSLFGLFLLVFWLIFFGVKIGGALGPKETPGLSWWLGILALLSGVMLTGSAMYYLSSLPAPVCWTIAILSIPISLWIGRKNGSSWFDRPHNLLRGREHPIPPAVYFAGSTILFLLFFLIQTLSQSSTTEAIRSPWIQVSPAFFLALFLLFLLLLALLMRGRERAFSLTFVSLSLFTFLCVTLLVFPVGYGFDSFIHQATETHIAEFGTITPKPFYYIGQYSLVLFFHHTFSLPVQLVDTFLVPILAALMLPIAFYSASVHLSGRPRLATASLIGLFFLPLSSFIVTTPQGLANLWTLFIILAAIPYMLRLEGPRVFPLLFFAFATLTIHPIAGIPIVLFVALLATDPNQTNDRLKLPASLLFWTILLLGSIILPASFVVNAILSGSGLGLHLSALTPAAIASALHVDLFFENRFHPLLDFVYLYGYNAILLFMIGAGVGWILYRKQLDGRLRVLCAMIAILAINFIILSTAVDFSFLIDYERLNYANRLIPLMAFFAAPFFLLMLQAFFSKVRTSPVIIRACTLVLLATVITSACYLTYPRDDAYEISHGFNVSQSDIHAVYAIEEMAQNTPYVVLANQSVSAAAIRTLGFTRYWDDLFFYPIPTGGELYEVFLQMNETPNQETAQKAADIIETRCEQRLCENSLPESVFYVVNRYWWQSDRLIETGKSNASDWTAIDDGAVYVFEYSILPQ